MVPVREIAWGFYIGNQVREHPVRALQSSGGRLVSDKSEDSGLSYSNQHCISE